MRANISIRRLTVTIALPFALVATALAQPVRPLVLPIAEDLRVAVVESVSMQARVVGHNAVTRVDIVLGNPNAVVIESALEFPLRDGQTVTGFSLESEDRTRFLAAAPVEKAKGQAVFEQIVREGADPGLLERTAGNHFKLRVYPIAARSSRTVRLEISEVLATNKSGRLTYQMPQVLKATRPQKFSFSVELDGVLPNAVQVSAGLKTATRSNSNGTTRIAFNPAHRPGTAEYALSWATTDREFTDFGGMDGETYFQAQVPLTLASEPRKLSNPVTLVWDASGSGAKRDHAREFAFLDAAFKSIGNTKVYLIETHVVAESPRLFEVKQGNWDALRDALEKVQYDGASNPAAWSVQVPLPRGYTKEELAGFKNLTLVFSDGIGNWGTPSPEESVGTVYAISAAAGANTAALRALAEPTGGQLIDLLQTNVAQAVAEITLARARLVRIHTDGTDQHEIVSKYAVDGVIQLTGHMTKDTANLVLEFEMPNGQVVQRKVALKAPALAAQGNPNTRAAKRWAEMRIARLEANARLHQTEILRLGSEFGVVSSRTSLIILERFEDYVRFDVMPSDPVWREQYRLRAKSKAAREATEQSAHLVELVKRFESRAKWWEADFPKDAKPEPKQESGLLRPIVAGAPAPAPSMMAAPASARMALAAPTPVVPPVQRAIAISVQKQQTNAPYAGRLRDARAEERYAIYLDEKSANATSSAFYLDAAEIFFENDQLQMGLRVLSNLAEIELEERALLRILAYRLQQAKMFGQAILLFKQIQVLAPNEPQSWRDLGLAYAANGQAQQAIDALWTTVSRKWDSRFADIDLIALGELNAIAANTQGLDLARIDPRLLRNLPVDLRVVMSWDADSTDIDLWVRDPNREDAYYGHKETYQGGRMSRDFTAGYGPEEFLLKHAKHGRYEVRGKFFGSRQQRFSPYTTVMVRFVTGFGTLNQKEQSVIMRLPERGSEVLLGSFEVKPD